MRAKQAISCQEWPTSWLWMTDIDHEEVGLKMSLRMRQAESVIVKRVNYLLLEFVAPINRGPLLNFDELSIWDFAEFGILINFKIFNHRIISATGPWSLTRQFSESKKNKWPDFWGHLRHVSNGVCRFLITQAELNWAFNSRKIGPVNEAGFCGRKCSVMDSRLQFNWTTINQLIKIPPPLKVQMSISAAPSPYHYM